MSINRQQKHVIFYGEDEATRDLATGFVLSEKINELRCMVWQRFGKGWQSTAEAIEVTRMSRYPETLLVLVIDLDRRGTDHVNAIKQEIDKSPFKDRVYIVGGAKDVQSLQRKFTRSNAIGKLSLQDTGLTIADRCSNDGSCLEGVWSEPELVESAQEVQRLCLDAKDVLFKNENV